MERGHKISVLDHGYVIFVDSMGSDEAIVEAARIGSGSPLRCGPYRSANSVLLYAPEVAEKKW